MSMPEKIRLPDALFPAMTAKSLGSLIVPTQYPDKMIGFLEILGFREGNRGEFLLPGLSGFSILLKPTETTPTVDTAQVYFELYVDSGDRIAQMMQLLEAAGYEVDCFEHPWGHELGAADCDGRYWHVLSPPPLAAAEPATAG